MNNSALFRAIKIIIYKDSNYFRSITFDYIKTLDKKIAFIEKIYSILPFVTLRSLLVFVYGLKSLIDWKNPETEYFAVYSYENERRQFDWLAREIHLPIELLCIGNIHLSEIPYLLRTLGSWLRIYRIILNVVKRYNFLVSCRISSTIFHYIKFKDLYSRNKCRGCFVASDSNPYALAATLSLENHKGKSIYINHGHLPEMPPRLIFDLNIIDGPALEDVFTRSKGIAGKVVYKGVEGEKHNLRIKHKEKYRVGIFLSLLTDWSTVDRVIDSLKLNNKIGSIKVRLHPNKLLWDHRAIQSIKQKNVEISDAHNAAYADMDDLDIIIAGNSSVHLTSLKYGIPSIHLGGLDNAPENFYLFVQDGLIPAITDIDSIDLDHLISFYEQENWIKILRYYDPPLDDSLILENQVKKTLALEFQ
jgi:hypothetical protein